MTEIYIPRCAEALKRLRAEINEPRDLRVVKALALAAHEAARRATPATPDVLFKQMGEP